MKAAKHQQLQLVWQLMERAHNTMKHCWGSVTENEKTFLPVGKFQCVHILIRRTCLKQRDNIQRETYCNMKKFKFLKRRRKSESVQGVAKRSYLSCPCWYCGHCWHKKSAYEGDFNHQPHYYPILWLHFNSADLKHQGCWFSICILNFVFIHEEI